MKIHVILPVILLITASCAPPRVVTRLEPEAPEGHYEQGREYIPLNNDEISVELGFDGIYGDYLVFDFVMVNNRATDTVMVNPLDFYYVTLETPTSDSSLFPPRMAIHPERIIHHYEQQLEEGEDRKEFNTILGVIDAGLGLLANTTAFVATENPGYITDAIFQTLGTADYYVANNRAIGASIEAIREESEIVREEIFRSVRIPPHSVASGFVYFPRYEDEGYLMFCFPAEDQMFQFVYNQTKSITYE